MRRQRHRIVNNPFLQQAHEALGVAGEEYNIFDYIATQHAHSFVLIQEHVHSKFYSLEKMRAFRWQRSSLDRTANDFLDSSRVPGRRLVVGIGSGGFPHTGRGEKSVPTKGIIKALFQAKRRRESEATR